jgi:integrase
LPHKESHEGCLASDARRNWRRRVYEPTAYACGLDGWRPYDLRHSFASLLIHEGRLSVVEIAAQLGHSPTMALNTYGHVIAELKGSVRISAEDQIREARRAARGPQKGPREALVQSAILQKPV